MARYRTIKPEFWASEQVANCDFATRLLFIGIWNFADDGGVIPDRPKQIRIQVFPADEFSDDDMGAMLNRLVEVGLLVKFENHGNTYYYVTGWMKHQRIDKPNPKYPKPFDENSKIVLGTLAECSVQKERKEDKGKEGKGTKPAGELDAEQVPLPPEISIAPFPPVWLEWIAYRREHRYSTRERTMRAQLQSLAPLGPIAAAECLRSSIRNGWQGIFPEKVNANGKPQQQRVGSGQRFKAQRSS